MLLKGDPEAIADLLRSMERDRANIEKEIASLVYYMNGGLNYVDAWSLSTSQIKSLSETINKHYEAQAEAMKKGSKRSM